VKVKVDTKNINWETKAKYNYKSKNTNWTRRKSWGQSLAK